MIIFKTLTCIPKVKLVLQRNSSDPPASELSEGFLLRMSRKLWTPELEKTSWAHSIVDYITDSSFLVPTCWASSLVGNTAKARTSHMTRCIRTWFLKTNKQNMLIKSTLSTCICLFIDINTRHLTWINGITNARVFPLPVGADTQISLGL